MSSDRVKSEPDDGLKKENVKNENDEDDDENDGQKNWWNSLIVVDPSQLVLDKFVAQVKADEPMQMQAIEEEIKPPPPHPASRVTSDHFASLRGVTEPIAFNRAHPSFVSPIYAINPAPSSKLARKRDALRLTDADGRIYWHAENANINVNRDWIARLKESAVYEFGDTLLLAQNTAAAAGAHHNSWPMVGEWHEFRTSVPPPGVRVMKGVDYTVRARIAYRTDNASTQLHARKTCYLLVRGPFEYTLYDEDEHED